MGSAYYEANKEKILAKNRAWREENKDRDRENKKKRYTRWKKENPNAASEYQRKRRYGLTKEDMVKMLEDQGGTCALCSERLYLKRETHVDHCHETGVVRGLLCMRHNTALGIFGDSPANLRNAAEYLSRTK